MGFGPTILYKKILRDKYKLSHERKEEEMKNIYNEYTNIFDNYEYYKDIPCIHCFSYIIYIKIPEEKDKWNWWLDNTSRIKVYLYNLNISCRFLEENKIEDWMNRLYIHKSFFYSLSEIELYLYRKKNEIHNEIEQLNIELDKVNNLFPSSESDKKNTSSPTTSRLTYDDFYFLSCTKNLNDLMKSYYEREIFKIEDKFKLLDDLECLKYELLQTRNINKIPSDSRSSSVVSNAFTIGVNDIDAILKKIKDFKKNIEEKIYEIYDIEKYLYMIKTLLKFLLNSDYCELFFINFDEEKLKFFDYKQLRIIRFHPFYDRTIKYSISRDIDGYISDVDFSIIYQFTNEDYDTIFYSLYLYSFFEINKNNNNTSSIKNLKDENNTSSIKNSKDENYLERFQDFLNRTLKKTVKIEKNKEAVYFYGQYALWQNTFQKCLCSMRRIPFPNEYHENSILSLVELENKESYSINNLNYCPFPMIACLFGTKFKLKRYFVLSTIDYLKNVMIEINASIENFYWFKELPDSKFFKEGKSYVKTSMETGFDEILLLLLFQFKGMKLDEDILKYKDSIKRNIVILDNKMSSVNGKSGVTDNSIYKFLNILMSNKFRINVFDNIVLANLYNLRYNIKFEKKSNQIEQIDKKLLKNQSDLNDEEKDEIRRSKNLLGQVRKNIQDLKKTLNENKRTLNSTTSSSVTLNNENQRLRTFLNEYKIIVDNREKKKNKESSFGDTDYKLQEVQSLIREIINEKN